MAKQAQSSSQLTVPQVMMRPIWPQLRRTAVIQLVIAVDQGHRVAPGRPVTATDSLIAPESTACSGRS